MLTFIYGEYLEEPPHLAKAVVMDDIIVIEFSVHLNIRGMRYYSSFTDQLLVESQSNKLFSERQNISTILEGLSSLNVISAVDTFSFVTKKTESVSFIISSNS